MNLRFFINKYNSLISLFIFSALSYLLFGKFNSVGYNFDSLKAITASKTLYSDTFSYWLQIFTQPIHIVQYRPLSIFAYFYWIRSIFGVDPISFRIIFLILLTILSTTMFSFFKRRMNPSLAMLSVVIFLIHPTHQYLVYEISHNLKYYGPLLFLFLSLEILSRDEISYKHYGFVILLITLSIMCHEASFVMPVVLLLYRYLYYKKINKGDFILILPSLTWLLTRVFIWRIPRKGEFQVNIFDNFLQKFIYYTNFSFGHIFQKFDDHGRVFDSLFYSSELILVAVVLLTSIFFSFKLRNRDILFSISSCLVLISPFMAMSEHVFGNRVMWAISFACCLYLLIIDSLFKQGRKYVGGFALALLLLLTFIHFDINGRQAVEIKYFKNYDELKEMVKQGKDVGARTFKLQFDSLQDEDFAMTIVLPGKLALDFPEKEIQIFSERYNLVVKNGSYYNALVGKNGVYLSTDPFQIEKLRDFTLQTPKIDFKLNIAH